MEATTGKMQTEKDKKVYTYDRIADLKRLDFIRKNLQTSLPPNGSVLDVGCGNGIISLQLGKDGFNIKGIDVSEKAIEKARATNPFPNVRFEIADADTLKAGGETFDAIICSEVLEHLNQPERLLKELFPILKDSGILLVTVPNGMGPREVLVTKPILSLRKQNNWLWRTVLKIKSRLGYSGTTIQSQADNLDHIQFFTYRDLQKLSQETGFKIERINSSNFIDDIFPVSLLSRRVKSIQKLDSYLADILPRTFTGGYLMVWKKSM
jgi:2-polyprenyl-3-methyl-5-hydroxy-6-metoxy-1,4-benzoquinol methylase